MARRQAATRPTAAVRTRKSSSSTRRIWSGCLLLAELLACLVALAYFLFGDQRQAHRAMLIVLCLGLLTTFTMLVSLRKESSPRIARSE